MKNKKTSSILEKLLEHVPKDPNEELLSPEEEEEEDMPDEQIAFLNPEKVKKFQRGLRRSTHKIG